MEYNQHPVRYKLSVYRPVEHKYKFKHRTRNITRHKNRIPPYLNNYGISYTTDVYVREHIGNNYFPCSVVCTIKQHEEKDGEYTGLLNRGSSLSFNSVFANVEEDLPS